MPHISFLAYNSIEYRFFYLVLVVLLRRDKSKYTYERIELSHTCIPNSSFSINKFYFFINSIKLMSHQQNHKKLVRQSDYNTSSCVLKSVCKDYVKLFSVVWKTKKNGWSKKLSRKAYKNSQHGQKILQKMQTSTYPAMETSVFPTFGIVILYSDNENNTR